MTAGEKGIRHVPSLDGLRGIAALMVFLTHATGALSLPESTRRLLFGSPLTVLLQPFGAVQLFFLLSGFVLASSASRGNRPGDLGQFYVRRIFRIHPPYVFAVLLAWGLGFLRYAPGAGLSPWPFGGWLNAHIPPDQLLRSLLFPGPAYGQLTVGWSLGVEMFYSLLLPFMMLIAIRIHWLALLLLSFGGLAIASVGGPHAWILGFGLHFSLGIAVYTGRARIAAFLRAAPRASGRILMVLSVAIFSLPVLRHGGTEAMNQIFAGVGGAGILIGAMAVPGVAAFLASPPVAFLGRIAYSFYLLHIPLIVQCGRIVGGPVGPLGAVGFVLLSLIVCVSISFLSYEWLERPSIRAGNALCRAIGRWTGVDPHLSRLVEGPGTPLLFPADGNPEDGR